MQTDNTSNARIDAKLDARITGRRWRKMSIRNQLVVQGEIEQDVVEQDVVEQGGMDVFSTLATRSTLLSQV